MKTLYLFEIATVVTLLVIGGWFGYGHFIEGAVKQPSYSVTQKDGAIEIRQYPVMILAKTPMDSSLNNGFRVLANYIFGGNNSKQKMAMTAPVITGDLDNSGMMMAFVLPEDINLSNAPKPSSNSVLIDEMNFESIASIRFSGYAKQDAIKKKYGLLTTWLNDNNVNYDPAVFVAQYNSPWVMGPFRRNEVWVRLK